MFDNKTLYIVCHGSQSEWIICDTLLDALKIRDIRIHENPTLTREEFHIRKLAPITSPSRQDPNTRKRIDHILSFETLYLYGQERDNAKA